MARSATTGFVFILGILFLIWTILALGASLSIYDDVTILVMCNTADFTVTGILLGYWFVRKKNEDRMDDLTSYLRMYRRVHISKVAQRLGTDEGSVEKILLKCISKGLIRGFLDRTTGEFILEESIAFMNAGAKCPNCGGFSDKVALPGEVLNCNYCGAIITQSGNQPKKAPRPQRAPTPTVKKARPAPPPSGEPLLHCPGCGRALPPNCTTCPYCDRIL